VIFRVPSASGGSGTVTIPEISTDSEGYLTVDGTRKGNSLKGDKGDKGNPGLQGASGEKGEDGVGVSEISSNQSGNIVTLNFRMSNFSSKSVEFTIPSASGGNQAVNLSSYYKGQYIDENFAKKNHTHTVSYNDLIEVPDTFKPSTHTHEEYLTIERFEEEKTNFSVGNGNSSGTNSPLGVEFEEIYNGSSNTLYLNKDISEFQFLQIRNSDQTATIPAKIGASFKFWYTTGNIETTKRIKTSKSETYVVYGIKLKGNVIESSGGTSGDLSNYYSKNESDEKFALITTLDNYFTKEEASERFALITTLSSYLRNDRSGRISGNLVATGDISSEGTVTGISDIRLKSNIRKIEDPLEILRKINGYTFDMRGEKHAGVIAQELLEVFPEVVRQREDGYYSVAYGNIVSLLIEANKELLRRIEVLENELKK